MKKCWEKIVKRTSSIIMWCVIFIAIIILGATQFIRKLFNVKV